MKANQVMKILSISRTSLCEYVKQNKIKVKQLHNGYYDYSEDDVFKLYSGVQTRKNLIYARVSTREQKKDLENQVQSLLEFCQARGVSVDKTFSDIASGISFEKRTSFFEMPDLILSGEVQSVFISYRDRLSRTGFGLFEFLFKKFGCQIIVMSEIGSQKLDSEEIFEEVISLLHCYSMKLYSGRRKKRLLKELISEES